MTLAEARDELVRTLRELGPRPSVDDWTAAHGRLLRLHRELRRAGQGFLDLEGLFAVRPAAAGRLPSSSR